MSGQESGRLHTENDWNKIEALWKADHAENTKVLKLIQKAYKPGSSKHKKIEEVMIREKAELDVILSMIDILHDSDTRLHWSDTTSSTVSTASGQTASSPDQAFKFCQFCGSKMPVVALYCQSCGRRQL